MRNFENGRIQDFKSRNPEISNWTSRTQRLVGQVQFEISGFRDLKSWICPISKFLLLVLVATSVSYASDVSLIDAVKQKNLPMVRALLQKHADVNAQEGDGATALHWAVYRDDSELVDLLIKAGARVNTANDLSITPLYLAAVNGNAAIVDKLLKAGANPEAASEAGVTPLM